MEARAMLGLRGRDAARGRNRRWTRSKWTAGYGFRKLTKLSATFDQQLAEIKAALQAMDAKHDAREEQERLRVPKIIICPRCRALGRVSAEIDGSFRVDWLRLDGSFPDCFEKADDWFDLGFTLPDLKRPMTGCGYDPS